MSVVCKMQCHENNGQAIPEDLSKNQYAQNAMIRLGAVWEGSTEQQQASENAIFGKCTPNGEIRLGINNPNAASFFQPGKKYYVTITEAPD